MKYPILSLLMRRANPLNLPFLKKVSSKKFSPHNTPSYFKSFAKRLGKKGALKQNQLTIRNFRKKIKKASLKDPSPFFYKQSKGLSKTP
jgi:hypothetical protein